MIVRDPEVLEVLRDEPELLAIADAIGAAHPRRRRRARWLLAAGAAAAVVAVVTLLLVAPWRTGGLSFTDRALAAVGNGPIIHFKDRYQMSQHYDVRIDLRTGRKRQLVSSQEVWSDQITGLSRTIDRVDGRVVDDRVTTSCSTLPNGPRAGERVCIPGLPTFFDFEQEYRKPLERGLFRSVGSGVYRGRPVVWLEVTHQPPRYPRTRVAIDTETYKPLVFRIFMGGQLVIEDDLLVLESLPSGSIRFPVPKGGAPYYGQPLPRVVAQTHPAGIAAAGRTLDAPPLWLAARAGYDLDSVRVGFERAIGHSGAVLASSPFVRLRYRANHPRRVLVIDEFSGPRARSLWKSEGLAVPPVGTSLLIGGNRTARLGPVFVRITPPTASSTQVISAVRALRARNAPGPGFERTRAGR